MRSQCDNSTSETGTGEPSVAADSVDVHDADILAAVRVYLAAAEAGRPLDRQEFLSRYARIADELGDWLDGLDFVDSTAKKLHADVQETASADGGSVGFDPASAEPLGDFRLVRQIGRGGMGVVYEAVQLSLGRRVAVKVLPMAAALDSRQLQRFKNEAHAAAQLHHTNIVPVYAIGCERNVHYYAMQLIDGQSLAEAIYKMRSDECGMMNEEEPSSNSSRITHHSSRNTSPTAALSTARSSSGREYFRSVARIGMRAAEALDYAHGQGVVHRDVKPENLLLDQHGNVWITDFGLAQFYSDANLTQTGAMVGTLRYMSPEQASGKGVVLDERTDVYSLGMTLYELLTLQRALPGETRAELLYQIDSLDPRPARSIDRTIPPELETILAKATTKDAADRYRTAGALAEDLQRFLRDEPIRARPPTVWDRAVKWTRRHKAIAASALVILLLATIGSAVSTAIIAREQAKTHAALTREREKSQEAKRSFRQAREAVDGFARIAVDEMDGPEFADVRRRMLEASLAYYQQFLNDRKDDPTIAAELATAQQRMEDIYHEILAEMSNVEEFFRLFSLVRLLEMPAVLDGELQLSADQQGEAQRLAQGLHREMDFPRLHELLTLGLDVQRQALTELAGRTQGGLDAILTAEQSKRLRQIALQSQGPFAFTEPEVAGQLMLTDQQREHVRTIQSEFREASHRFFGRGPRLHSGRHAEEYANVYEQAMASVLSQLTPQQQDIWNRLRGEVFPVERLMPPLPGPRGGPPHGPPPLRGR